WWRPTAAYHRPHVVRRLRRSAQGIRQRSGIALHRRSCRNGPDGPGRIACHPWRPAVCHHRHSQHEGAAGRAHHPWSESLMIGVVQRALRSGLMGVEAVFNRSFGDQLNPFYHLGKITFFLFWIIAVTGLILYIFFDTSVEGAYQSVEAVSSGAWGLGNLIRGLHRYGSDAMVLT